MADERIDIDPHIEIAGGVDAASGITANRDRPDINVDVAAIIVSEDALRSRAGRRYHIRFDGYSMGPVLDCRNPDAPDA